MRAEIYIDCGDRERNKVLFDALCERKDQYEEIVGSELLWDRLEDKRAARISISRDGAIDGPEGDLPKIRNWLVEKLLVMKQAFGSDIVRIAQEQWT